MSGNARRRPDPPDDATIKVRVAYTVEVPTWLRRAINEHYGRPGLASREEIRRWYETFGSSMDMDLAQPDDDTDRFDADGLGS